jgi:hypothetical protein
VLEFQVVILDAFTNCLSPAAVVVSKLIPVLRIDACGFVVTLADVLVSQCWATCWAFSCGKISMYVLNTLDNKAVLCLMSYVLQHVLWNATVLHAMHMAQDDAGIVGDA